LLLLLLLLLLYRRSMYTFWRRTAPPASMMAFDAPSREFCMVKRERTATPLQALVTLNDPQFVEAARVLAEKLMKKYPGKTDEQLAEAYRLCTSHVADDRQQRILADLRNSQQKQFASAEKQARELLAVGETKRDESLPAADHAAFTNTILALFNFDPFVIKR
ncbi:MAG: DUF1553 domain-containing protein, partial [bacterium]